MCVLTILDLFRFSPFKSALQNLNLFSKLYTPSFRLRLSRYPAIFFERRPYCLNKVWIIIDHHRVLTQSFVQDTGITPSRSLTLENASEECQVFCAPVSFAVGTTHSLIRGWSTMECSGGNTKSCNRVVLSLNPSGYEEPRVMSTGRGLRGWMDRRCERERYVTRDSSRFYVYGHGVRAAVCVACELWHTHDDTNERRCTKEKKKNVTYYTQLVRSRKKKTVRPSPCISSNEWIARYRSSNVLINVVVGWEIWWKT